MDKVVNIELKDYTSISIDEALNKIYYEDKYKSYQRDLLLYKFFCDLNNIISQNKIFTIGKDGNKEQENGKSSIFYQYNGSWYTSYVGAISVKINDDVKVNINIKSRFDDENSHFLMYLFQKAFNINGLIFEDMEVAGKKEQVWDLLLVLLFFSQLKEALKKACTENIRSFILMTQM